MGVRCLLIRTLGESERPEIIKGGFSFWQWDKWVFCAAYQSAFSGPKEDLLRRAASLDSIPVPQTYVGPYVPVSMTQVAGHEALKYLFSKGVLTETESSGSQMPKTAEFNDVTGGEDGIFLSRTILTPSLSADESVREQELRDTAMIFLFMRERCDYPIFTNEEPLMVFGASDTSIHQLKRAGGSGSQFVSLPEMESLSDQDAIIGVEVLKRNGSLAVLKYKTKLRSMAAIVRKVVNRCKEIAKSKSINSPSETVPFPHTSSAELLRPILQSELLPDSWHPGR